MLILVMSVLIFAAIMTAAAAMVQSSASEKNPITLRLRELRMLHHSNIDPKYARTPPLLFKLLAQVGGFLPAKNGSDALRTGLVRAGYRRGDAVVLFLGSKVLFAAALPILWSSLAYVLARPFGNIVTVSFILGGIGFYLPTLWIAIHANQRRSQITAALPDALDLMVVCVEAGLGIAAAIQRVGQEIRLASPALAEEFALVNSEMQTGVSRSDALRNLAERTGVEDIHALVAMLIQTDRLGTSIAQSLRSHADSMRTKRRQRAEQLARKASIKLAFPLVFLIFPALLLVILGPAGMQLIKALAAGE
jgi:tight adherence protein C